MGEKKKPIFMSNLISLNLIGNIFTISKFVSHPSVIKD